MMEISPNGKYLVTYSEEDNTIVGWNVEDIKKGEGVIKDVDRKEDEVIGIKEFKDIKESKHKRAEFIKECKHETNNTIKINSRRKIYHMCVSDKKILAYIHDNDNRINRINDYKYYFGN